MVAVGGVTLLLPHELPAKTSRQFIIGATALAFALLQVLLPFAFFYYCFYYPKTQTPTIDTSIYHLSPFTNLKHNPSNN